MTATTTTIAHLKITLDDVKPEGGAGLGGGLGDAAVDTRGRSGGWWRVDLGQMTGLLAQTTAPWNPSASLARVPRSS